VPTPAISRRFEYLLGKSVPIVTKISLRKKKFSNEYLQRLLSTQQQQ
jgi:hypothetical protein